MLHNIKIIIRNDLEQIEGLVKHLPMLGGHTDPTIEKFRMASQLFDHRSHFDCLRASTENRKNLLQE
jgi:hypothetical protein